MVTMVTKLVHYFHLSCVRLFVTPWTRALQALLTSTASWSWVKFMLVASMTLSNYLILCRPLLLLPLHFHNIRVFSREEEVERTTKSELSPQPTEIEQEIKPERELGARRKEKQVTVACAEEEEKIHESEIGEGEGRERHEEEKWKKRSETTVEGKRGDWSSDRERVDVFLMTEEGNRSKETEKVTVVKEKVTEEPDEKVQVFSVPQKRPAESNIHEEYRDPAKGNFKRIIPGLSPEEWTVLVYHRAHGPEKMVHQLDPAVEKELLKEGDWARHPCCGTLCAVRNGFMRMPTEKEKYVKTYY